jgi:hypothetical protein
MIAEKRILNVRETVDVLTVFYRECVEFWKREGYPRTEAVRKAFEDIERLNTNPFEPDGDWLDQKAKLYFMECKANL